MHRGTVRLHQYGEVRVRCGGVSEDKVRVCAELREAAADDGFKVDTEREVYQFSGAPVTSLRVSAGAAARTWAAAASWSPAPQ